MAALFYIKKIPDGIKEPEFKAFSIQLSDIQW